MRMISSPGLWPPLSLSALYNRQWPGHGTHVNQCKEMLEGCLMLTAMQGSCACVNLAPARMRRAIAAAEKAAPAMAALGSWQRREVLEHCVREFQARFEELALSLCIEAGKPIKVP